MDRGLRSFLLVLFFVLLISSKAGDGMTEICYDRRHKTS